MSMLAETRRSVTEIAQLVGYADVPSFRRVFVATTGVSPNAWRSRHRANRSDRDASGCRSGVIASGETPDRFFAPCCNATIWGDGRQVRGRTAFWTLTGGTIEKRWGREKV